MLKIWRFCAVLFTTTLFGFSANAAIDCTNMEPEFSVTINMTSAANFSFSISAAGDFCIDWGDGTIDPKTKDTSNTTYSHPYKSAGTYTIGISGDATAYNAGTSVAAISFSGKTQVTNISGSLGAIFPTLSDGTQPRFVKTFYACKNLTGTITSDLFDGIHGQPTTYMFQSTFENCDNLSGELPYGLFDDLSGTLTTKMFYRTFKRNALSGTLTPAFFGGLTIDDWNSSALEDMFDDDAELTTSCPDGVTAITNSLNVTLCESAGTPTCDAGYWLNGNTCEQCPNGYTSPAGATAQDQCYTTCATDCVQPTCPGNATCAYGNETENGTQNWGDDTCIGNAPTCSITSITCNAGYWLNGNTCEQCPDGYTSPAGATAQNQCYTECTVDCKQSTCPENATCEYGNETANGTQNWGGTCSATAPTCPVTITCNTGYWLNGNTCEICPAGSYCANNIKTECESGTYTDATGQTSCTICPVGSYCAGGIKLECVAGTYTDTTRQSECAICPIGSYCVGGIRHTCPDGQFTDETQRTTCTICPIGSACSNGIRTECPDGQYTNATGQTVCTSCPMGSYCTAGIINQCVVGTYSDAPGMSVCTTCPDGTTSVPGAISANQCGNTKVLHIGDTATMNLFTVRPEQKPYMVFDINGVQYYGEMSTTQTGITDGSDVKFKILHNDTEYYLHDFSAK